jgi:hypothetical protein
MTRPEPYDCPILNSPILNEFLLEKSWRKLCRRVDIVTMPRPSISENRLPQRPKSGTYVIRFVKGGPLVPARLELANQKLDQWSATVGGLLVCQSTRLYPDPLHAGDRPIALYTGDQIEGMVFQWLTAHEIKPPEAAFFVRIVVSGHEITNADYQQRLLTNEHWRKVLPEHPLLQWYEPADLSRLRGLGRYPPPPVWRP